ncbi:MAG: hypothetical protein NC123_08480 [Butyrivibrio sp.]|nr:hypothetical protein [Butyrivibrio sp.]
MFDAWLEQEKADIKAIYGMQHILCVILALMLVPFFLMNLIVLLDGGGALSMVVVAFGVFALVLIPSMGNYKKRFIKPLLASVERDIPSGEERQEFARQMQETAVVISYYPLPQRKACDIMVAESYCYMRQPGKSRIFKNSEIRRAVLQWESYTAGMVGHLHFRGMYAMELYAAGNERKPIWKGYFADEGDLYQAFDQFKPSLPQEAIIQDNVAAG